MAQDALLKSLGFADVEIAVKGTKTPLKQKIVEQAKEQIEEINKGSTTLDYKAKDTTKRWWSASKSKNAKDPKDKQEYRKLNIKVSSLPSKHLPEGPVENSKTAITAALKNIIAAVESGKLDAMIAKEEARRDEIAAKAAKAAKEAKAKKDANKK